MKKWWGGLMIIALALILILSYYTFIATKSQRKGGAYEFFQSEFTPSSIQHKVVMVDVIGLDLLYNYTSLHSLSQALLVWVHMRFLLSRSDTLPETALGVKEASVAWTQLLSIIKHPRKHNDHIMNCPFSVSLSRDANANPNLLELPCGLVEDSSISLIGVPHNTFQIDLLGSQLLPAGDSFPPIALHYNVSLIPAYGEPFILQNTWTPLGGWGNHQRCPPHPTSHNYHVDGLVLCNTHVFSSSSVSHNVTHAQSGSFPFTQGIPFVATLWAGFHGFHMTVNGRHETSFAYREKLEPWLVSKVKVSGGLKLVSALAKELPVSEHHHMMMDAKQLKAPPLGKKTLLMLVGVFSSANNFERRMAIRRTWMQYQAVRSGDVAVRFFIGLHKNKQVNYEVWVESEAYGDIQLMPFVDYYSLLTYKTMAVCIMGTKILPAKYIMKTDDDAFVRIDQVLLSLKTKPANGLLYGLISYDSSPHRDTQSKWYISNEEWPHNTYPPWAHGPGYVISRDIAKFIVHQRDLKLFKLEDVGMGIWIEEYKKTGQQVQYISDERFHNAGCESDYILAHYQTPRLLLCLWDKLLNQHNPFCCE